MPRSACAFTHAVMRRPAPSVVNGLRAEDCGAPDLAGMLDDHATYAAALAETGAEVVMLDPLDAYPDALFVEDTALCLPEGAILLRPGAPSRAGEVEEIAPALGALVPELRRLGGEGHAEGGDILWTGREVIVGLSARTDAAGAAALGAILREWGHAMRVCDTPAGVLHFKSDCALLDEETVLATPRLAASGCFAGYRVMPTPEGEEAAANAIRFNDAVVAPAGFPRTAAMLDAAGYALRLVPNGECAKLDGGMSCLSLRLAL